MHQKAKITEHMLEFGWGEGWGIKLIWLTWWNSLLQRCEPLPCHETLKKRGPNKSQVRKLLLKSSMGEALGGWGIAHLIQIWDSAEPLPWFPLAVIYGSLGCARRWDPLKKQGEGIIIARGKKKHLEIKHSCGREKKQGCGFERREHGSCTHLQRSALPPSVPWFQMTSARGSRCNKSEMNRTCSRGVDAANGAQKRQPPAWRICNSIPSEMLSREPGCVHGWWWIREKWPPAEESEEP